MRRAQFANDVLAGTMYGKKYAAEESASQLGGRGFEGLGVGAEPDVDNAVATNPLIHAAGDGFHFGELGHGMIVASRQAG